MKIGIIGLSHLGLVYAAGFADLGNEVLAVDENAESLLKEISADNLSVFEAGLNDLLKYGISKNLIKLTSDFTRLSNCQIVILSLDTPLNKSGSPDLKPIFRLFDSVIFHLAPESLFLVSSQVIAGTCDLIQKKINRLRPKDNIEVVCFPENLRVGQAIEYFFKADRFIIGTGNQAAYEKIADLLKLIESPKIRMSIRSAEISKHALNAFLALQVSFINEIADICDACSADVVEVAEALKSDSRIGQKAYLNAGLGITSPPLIRELNILTRIAARNNLNLFMIKSVLRTNKKQPIKIVKMLKRALGKPLAGKKVEIFGLSYKEGTAFLGKSAAPFIIRELENSQIQCQIYQSNSSYYMAKDCNALLFLNPEKEFLKLDFDKIGNLMADPKIIFDARNFLPESDLEAKGFRYLAIGRRGKNNAS